MIHLILSLMLGLSAEAQNLSGKVLRLSPTTLPATCTIGDIRVDSANNYKVSSCTALNTWTPILSPIVNADISVSAAIDASKIADGTVSSTEFQYINSLTSNAQTQINTKASTTDLSTHEADTTSIHGITDTSVLVTLAGAQTLTNKTLTTPAITSPTGIVKGDVGLGSVDNTSDATKNAASVTLTNKTLTSPIVNLANFTEQGSSPGSPSAGQKLLYAKTDGKVYTKDSAGLESQVGAGAGGSGKNYLQDLFSGESVTGINRYADAVAASPVDGTGGSSSLTAAALNTSTPLRGLSSQRLSKTAVNEQGEGWSYDFTLDRADYEGAKPVVVSFRYKTSAGYVNNDVRMFVYDRDGATLLNVTSLTGDGSVAASTSTTLYTGVFYPNSANNDYRLIFHVAGTTAAAWDVDVVDLRVSPDQTVPGAIVADLGTETWTDSEANSTTTVKLTRNGQWLEVEGITTATGVFTLAQTTVTVPTAYTFDPAVYPTPATKIHSLGHAHFVNNASSAYHEGKVHTVSTTALFISASSSSAAYGAPANLSATVPFTWANGDKVMWNARWRVTGWSASAALSTTETMLTATRARYSTNAAQSIPSSTITIINFEDVTFDTPGTSVTTGAAWKFTASKTGYYKVKAQIDYDATTSFDADEVLDIALYKNGSIYSVLQSRRTYAGEDYPSASGVDTIYLTRGDYVDIRTSHNSGGAVLLLNQGTLNYVTIEELPDFSIFSVYGTTEYQEAVSSSATNWPFSAGAYGDLTSIALSPGEWDISATMETTNNGAVTAGNVAMAISSTSGNSATGISVGVNRVIFPNAGTTGLGYSLTIPSYRQVITTATTYYLKGICISAVANFQYTGYRLSARRIK